MAFSYLGIRLLIGAFLGWIIGLGVWFVYPRLMMTLGLMVPFEAVLIMAVQPGWQYQIGWGVIVHSTWGINH